MPSVMGYRMAGSKTYHLLRGNWVTNGGETHCGFDVSHAGYTATVDLANAEGQVGVWGRRFCKHCLRSERNANA